MVEGLPLDAQALRHLGVQTFGLPSSLLVPIAAASVFLPCAARDGNLKRLRFRGPHSHPLGARICNK